jgi:hypothetical protein
MKVSIGHSSVSKEQFLVDADRHLLVLGKTGTGKSTLLKNIVVDYLRQGYGVTVCDPHGNLVDDLLRYVPKPRTKQAIYFDPKVSNIGLNPLDSKDPELAIESLVTLIRAVWPEGWGPQSDYILTNLCRAVLLRGRASPLDALKAITSTGFRKKLHSLNPDFFEIYDGWDERQRDQATAPVLNKLGKLTGNPVLRASMSTRSLDFTKLLDNSLILLARLSKGELGADVSSILGSTIVSKLMLSALGRKHRTPHLVVLDEVQSFTKGIPIDVILSEARKYGLTLTVATQTIEQLQNPHAIFGNVNTILSYRMGGEDAEAIAKEFGDQFPASAILKLLNFEFYTKTVLNSVPREPVKLRAHDSPTFHGDEQKADVLVRTSVANWSHKAHIRTRFPS